MFHAVMEELSMPGVDPKQAHRKKLDVVWDSVAHEHGSSMLCSCATLLVTGFTRWYLPSLSSDTTQTKQILSTWVVCARYSSPPALVSAFSGTRAVSGIRVLARINGLLPQHSFPNHTPVEPTEAPAPHPLYSPSIEVLFPWVGAIAEYSGGSPSG